MCSFMPCCFCLSARKESKMNEKEFVEQNFEVEMSKTLQIRNSTIDFLVFTKQNSQDSIEVRVQNENVWLTQGGISRLFDVDRSVVTKHLKNIFEINELDEISVCAKFAHTAADCKTYNTKFYNLDAIISVGYRVNSTKKLPISTPRVSITARMPSPQGIFSRMCRISCTGRSTGIPRPS